MAKSKPEQSEKKLRTVFFPAHNKMIKASNLSDAQVKLKKYLNKEKDND